MLEVRNLHKSFNKVKIINGIELTVPEGQRHAIIGPNGAGKTTFFNLLSGKYRPTEGEIVFDGQTITGLPPHRINRLGLARSFQITNVFPGLSVFENIRAVILARRGIRFNFFGLADGVRGVEDEALAVLEQIGLADKRAIPAGELAYGQLRALEIGLTLTSRPKMILLDEPTAGMSMDETRQAIELIDKITEGITLVIIEHDMEVVFTLADQITVIGYGSVLASGPPEEIRGHPKVIEAYLGDHC